MNPTIKVMLVEDSTAYRKVVTRTLGDERNIELISQFGTAEIALRSLQDMRTRNVPDVLLLDLNLPGMSGLESIPFFKQSIPDTEILVLTQSNKEADILKAISRGATGYLLKASTLDQLTDGIRTVINGGASLDPNVASFILQTLSQQPPPEKTKKTLSSREMEILVLLSHGLLKKEIADQLAISINTVAKHIVHIYEKLEVKNAPAAINKAYRTGIFPSPTGEAPRQAPVSTP